MSDSPSNTLPPIPPFLDRRAAPDRRPIDAIDVGQRHRHDLGDIAALAKSIEEVGLLHPIVVTLAGTLIAGQRRLEACRRLGWTDIPVRVVHLDEIVRGELAENAERKDFLPSEIHAIRKAMAPEMAEKATSRKLSGRSADNAGETRDKIGAFAGRSGRTVEKITKVVAAAEREPERFAHLVEEMDRTGKVNGAFRKLRKAEDERRIQGLRPVQGKFRTLVIDPPWDYDWLSLTGRATPGYATMGHAELLALDVAAWAEEDCHLYLWTPNNFATRAMELMARWGIPAQDSVDVGQAEMGARFLLPEFN